ncbi:MAG: DUF3822 family protein [Bacteroidaceae bacterium]|nr:DUF3822 family protein [Bacteroidaceae bacterium]
MMDTLYLRVGMREMWFAAGNGSRGDEFEVRRVAFKPDVSLNVNVHEALQTEPLAKGTYQSVHALCEGRATLVPLSEFDEDDCEDLYFFNFPGVRQRLRVLYDALPHQNAVLLFGASKDVCHTLQENYPQVLFQSVETPLLLHFASCSPRALLRRRLFVNLTAGAMSLAACKGGRIELYNAYALHHAQDALYYTLHVAKVWGFDPATDEAFVSGERALAEGMAKSVAAYLPNVFVVRPEEEFSQTTLPGKGALPYDFLNLLLRAF